MILPEPEIIIPRMIYVLNRLRFKSDTSVSAWAAQAYRLGYGRY